MPSSITWINHSTLIHKVDANTQRQFAQQQSQIAQRDTRVSELEGAIKNLKIANEQLWSEVTICKRAVDAASSAPASLNLASEASWDSQIDLGICKGHSSDAISLKSFACATASWLQKNSMEPGRDFDFCGDPALLQTDRVIAFKGLDGVAARKAQSCLRKLKLGPNAYEQFWAETPTGTWVQVFVSGDKSARQDATEVSSKRMREVVEGQISQGETVTAARREGVVCLDQVPLVIILPQANGDTNLQWNEPLLFKSKLEKSKLTASFEEASSLAAASGSGPRALRARMSGIEWRP